MKFSLAMMLISVLGIGGILYTTIMNEKYQVILMFMVVGVIVIYNTQNNMVHSVNN